MDANNGEIVANGVAYLPAGDALGNGARLVYGAAFPFLGVPIEVWSNSATAMAVAERTFGRWRALPGALVKRIEPRRVSIVVHAPPGAGGGAEDLQPFTYRVHGDTFVAASGENLLTAHFAQGEAVGFVTPGLVANEAHFRYNVVESLALALTMWQDRTAVHAAGVVRNGRAVLLAGPSGRGKSTLCYAALRRGWDLLSEDIVYVSLRPRPHLWGLPGRVHLLPDAPRHFAELAGVAPQVQANGKLKIAVDVPAERLVLQAERAVVCLLARGAGGGAWLEPLSTEALVEALCGRVESGFDLDPRMREAVEAVAAGGAFRLVVGDDLEAAADCLERLTETETALEPAGILSA